MRNYVRLDNILKGDTFFSAFVSVFENILCILIHQVCPLAVKIYSVSKYIQAYRIYDTYLQCTFINNDVVLNKLSEKHGCWMLFPNTIFYRV